MNPRLATTIAAITLAVLAAATGCTSTSPGAAKPAAASATPSPADTYMDGVKRSAYLDLLRFQTTDSAAKFFPHFTRQQSSDAKLLATAHEACADLQGHAPGDVLAMLKQDGWTGPEALTIMNGATEMAYCWDQYPKVRAWTKTAGPAILGTS